MKCSPGFIQSLALAIIDERAEPSHGPIPKLDQLKSMLYLNADEILSDLIDFAGIVAKCAPWNGVERRGRIHEHDSARCVAECCAETLTPDDGFLPPTGAVPAAIARPQANDVTPRAANYIDSEAHSWQGVEA